MHLLGFLYIPEIESDCGFNNYLFKKPKSRLVTVHEGREIVKRAKLTTNSGKFAISLKVSDEGYAGGWEKYGEKTFSNLLKPRIHKPVRISNFLQHYPNGLYHGKRVEFTYKINIFRDISTCWVKDMVAIHA
jgi:hypothetical protein